MSTRYSLLVNNQAVFSYILNLDYIMSTRYTWIFFLIFDHIQRDVWEWLDEGPTLKTSA